MSIYNLVPDGGDVIDAGCTAVGAASIPLAIDDTPASHDGDSTYANMVTSGGAQQFRVTLGPMVECLAINKITLHVVLRNPGSFSNTLIPFLWIAPSVLASGTRYNGTTRVLGAGSSYTDYTDVFATNPATGGAWTKAQLDLLIVGIEQTLNATEQGRCTSYYVEVDYIPIPLGISAARDIGTHRLRRLRRPVEMMESMDVPLEFLDLELLDDLSVVYDAGPHAQGLGWGLKGWERRLVQLMTEEIDPGQRCLRLGVRGRRAQLYSYLDFLESRRSSSPLEDGVARLTSGSPPVFTQAGLSYVEDPGSGLIVLIGENQKPIALGGMLFENFISQRNKRTSFVSGTTFLTLTPGPNGATIAPESPPLSPLFDPSVSNNCMLFTAGNPHSGASTLLFPDTGNYTAGSRVRISLDHMDDSGAALALRVQRLNDNFFWNDATPGFQAGTVDNNLPVRTTRDRDALKVINMPGVAAALRITLIQPSGGSALRKNRAYHLQGEEGDGLITSRVVCDGIQVARNIMTYRVPNPSGKRVLNATRGTFFCEFKPLWNTADTNAHYVFFKAFFSANEAWNLYHDYINQRIAFQARTSSVTYETVRNALIAKGTWYKLAARWTSTAGELGLPARTLSVYLWTGSGDFAAAKGTDVVRGGDPIDASDIYIGGDSSGNTCNAQIRRLFFTPEVYSDEMIGRL